MGGAGGGASSGDGDGSSAAEFIHGSSDCNRDSGQQRPLRVVVCGWHHNIFLQVDEPMWRIYNLKAALHDDGRPSGVVPGAADGGRSSRPWLRCGREGPDCFFLFSFGVLCVKVQDCFKAFV